MPTSFVDQISYDIMVDIISSIPYMIYESELMNIFTLIIYVEVSFNKFWIFMSLLKENLYYFIENSLECYRTCICCRIKE